MKEKKQAKEENLWAPRAEQKHLAAWVPTHVVSQSLLGISMATGFNNTYIDLGLLSGALTVWPSLLWPRYTVSWKIYFWECSGKTSEEEKKCSRKLKKQNKSIFSWERGQGRDRSSEAWGRKGREIFIFSCSTRRWVWVGRSIHSLPTRKK